MKPSEQIARLEQIVEDLLSEARRMGADAAEAGVSTQTGLSVTVRLGETETIEHTSDNGLGVTGYFGRLCHRPPHLGRPGQWAGRCRADGA